MGVKKVTGQALITKDDLILKDPGSISRELRTKFLGNNSEFLLNVSFEAEKAYKSKKQLAYLYNAIGRRAFEGYKRWGRRCRNYEIAVELLKMDCDFVETIVDDNTGEILMTIPKSISSAKMDEVYEFIQAAVVFVQNDMGIPVPTPEEYLREKKWH